jgi:hypothetical protein
MFDCQDFAALIITKNLKWTIAQTKNFLFCGGKGNFIPQKKPFAQKVFKSF